MKALLQTGRSGINSIEIRNTSGGSLSPIAVEIETEVVPILPYDLAKLNGIIATSVPYVMGYGAVGKITKAGNIRKNSLVGSRVLVLNPRGTFSEKIISNFPPLVFPLSPSINSLQAVTIVGGLDAAYVLYKKIMKKKVKSVVITGANSVVGLALLQLLKKESLQIYPLVREESLDYFQSKAEEYNLPIYHVNNEKIPALVIDISGSLIQLKKYIDSGVEIISIARPDISGVHFISEPLMPTEYKKLLRLLETEEVKLPIDRVFNLSDTKEAFYYQESGLSRGRNIISFKEVE